MMKRYLTQYLIVPSTLCFVAAWFGSQIGHPVSVTAESIPENLVAKAFTLVDEQGNPRGIIKTTPDNGAAILLASPKSGYSAALVVSEESAAVRMTGDGGKPRIQMATYPDGSAMNFLQGDDFNHAVSIASKKDTGSTIELFDKAGLLRLGMIANSQPLNTNSISLFDQTGKIKIRFGLGRDGIPDTSFYDNTGERNPINPRPSTNQ